jgi:ankyrin repeat protein
MKYFKKILYIIVAVWISGIYAGAFDDFFRAIRTDDAATVGQLLERGFDPNTHEESGQSALTLAVRERADHVIDALLKHPQLEVNAQNRVGETPLMLAALQGRLDLVRRLLDRGASVAQEGWTPLHYAASGPDAQVVALLLARGAAIEARSPNGTTPLMMAARYGNEQSVAVLLEHHADTQVRNDRGMNAVDFARSVGREALAKRLESRSR